MITSGMKKGVPENQRANFVPVMHSEAELKKLVGYKESDDAYLVVLDRRGKVVFQTHGATSDRNYAPLRAKLENLLK
jgi:predicted transcriptional regulator